MKKIFTLIILSVIILNANAQSWTACGAISGEFDGSYTNISPTESVSLPSFIVNPSSTILIPNTEYLIVLRDSLASDSLGDVIIQTSVDGLVSPNDLGLTISDTFSVVPFSYNLLYYKKIVHSILNGANPFTGTCCYSVLLFA